MYEGNGKRRIMREKQSDFVVTSTDALSRKHYTHKNPPALITCVLRVMY
jgi:hypothetical protein